MKKQVSFRFDIDTHKCINEGVAPLLELANKTNSKFTFFINMGKAISQFDSFFSVLKKGVGFLNQSKIDAYSLSAFHKLGLKDYIYAAIVNPPLRKYQNKIREIISSGNELGLHGGFNHEKWHRHASGWNKFKISQEIEYGLNSINLIDPNYIPIGFASPGWASSQLICDVVSEGGVFKYLSDINTTNPYQEVQIINGLRHIPTNILGDHGVAFFEFCTAKRLSESEKIDHFFKKIKERQDLAVVYDHPYWAGINEIKTLEHIIKRLQDEQYNIKEMRYL